MEESKQNANDALTNNSAATKAELLKKYFKEEMNLEFSTITFLDEPPKKDDAEPKEVDNVRKIAMLEKENERFVFVD